MLNEKLKFTIKLFSAVIITLGLSISLQALLAWTPPGDTPPNANVSGPINVGSNSQTKIGSFTTNQGIFVEQDLNVTGNIKSNYIELLDGVYINSSNPWLSKPENTRMNFYNVGSVNSENPFWRGYQFAPPGIIKLLGVNKYPRLSMYWNFDKAEDPTDLGFNYTIGNTGGLTAHMNFQTDIGGAMLFKTSNTERMRIAADGNVGIGTTNPGTNKLEVVGGLLKATGGLVIETRASDPASPVNGQIWLIQ